MTTIATCGHDITDVLYYQVAMKTMVVDFDEDRLVEAEETGVYCSACAWAMFFEPDFLWMQDVV